MSALRRPDSVVLKDVYNRLPGQWSRLRAFSLILSLGLLPILVPSAHAQVANAQRAIERLEGCDQKERKNACINILKRKSAGEKKIAIKAQVRGGRIIWYEYDKKTGNARRTN